MIKQVCLRLNLDKPLDREAYDFLLNADKKQFKSYTRAACIAVTDYFKRYYKSLDDPYLETREREDRFTEQIVSAVEKSLEKVLPSFLTACLAGIVQPFAISMPVPAPSQETEPKAEEVDWDFLNG